MRPTVARYSRESMSPECCTCAQPTGIHLPGGMQRSPALIRIRSQARIPLPADVRSRREWNRLRAQGSLRTTLQETPSLGVTSENV